MTRIEGVSVATLTPRGKDGREADTGAVLELIDFVCAAGVKGIAVLGSTGEFINLSHDARVRLTYLAVKRSRVPVLAGVAHASLYGALDLGREACSAGAAGLLLMPPYFFRYSQADVKEFFLQFVSGVGKTVPVYLYNVPFFTTEIGPETAADLLSTGLFAGIKDSSGRMDYFERMKNLREQTPFTLLVGNDIIFTRARQAGADGVVSGVACVAPELMLGLDYAMARNDAQRMALLESKLQEFIQWIDRFPVPVGLKIAAAERGMKMGPCALPFSPETKRAEQEFREWLRGWLPTMVRDAAGA